MDDELIFQPVDRAAVDKVDARPEVPVDDFGVRWQPGLPIVGLSLEIRDHGARFFLDDGLDAFVGAHEVEFDHVTACSFCLAFIRRRLQGHGNAFGREVERFVLALDVVGHLLIQLSTVRDEVNRHPPISTSASIFG